MASLLSLVLGGVRSGKSAFAEKLAGEINKSTLYVATGLPTDQEMEERIRRHRKSRPAHWTTLEEPLELAVQLEVVMSGAEPPGVVVIDSLDLWVSNMLLELGDQHAGAAESSTLCAGDRMLRVIDGSRAAFVLVSSEVGLSLVAPEPLGRRFQDLLGLVNQRMAAAADRVYLMVAGIPTEIKRAGGT